MTLGVAFALALGLTTSSPATDEMEKEARRLGFPAKNCLYCHASPHAVEKMKETAREMGVSAGNCLPCHGKNIPAALNDRGQWLVAEKERRSKDRAEMAWLRDYVEPEEKEGEEGEERDRTPPPEE